VAVKYVGAETFRLCRDLIDGVVLVDNAATSAAIKVRPWVNLSAGIHAGMVCLAAHNLAIAHFAVDGLERRRLEEQPSICNIGRPVGHHQRRAGQRQRR